MRIPHSICINTFKTYRITKYHIKKARVLCAEDFLEWDKTIPKNLIDLCIEVVADYWEGKFYFQVVLLNLLQYWN